MLPQQSLLVVVERRSRPEPQRRELCTSGSGVGMRLRRFRLSPAHYPPSSVTANRDASLAGPSRTPAINGSSAYSARIREERCILEQHRQTSAQGVGGLQGGVETMPSGNRGHRGGGSLDRPLRGKHSELELGIWRAHLTHIT